jgi:hypothetical protein
MPRDSLRKIAARDRHAAAKLAEIRQRHPNAAIFVLFGESHLAPGHLPNVLRKQIPSARTLTVLQNIDPLYWRAAGERIDKVDAVRVSDDVLCVFNATPLEKYESYRLFLDQWSRCDKGPDFAPTIYNLIDSLGSFLEIDRYSPHNTTQPKFLVDLLPEVYGGSSDGMLRRLLARKGVSDEQAEAMFVEVEESGSAYLPQVNAFYVREFQMMQAAEDVTRFLHHACRGLPARLRENTAFIFVENTRPTLRTIDDFYTCVMENAVAYLGSRILYPSRPAPDTGICLTISRAAYEDAAREAIRAPAEKFAVTARAFGYGLGSQMYAVYLAGKVKPSGLRRLFLAHLDKPGLARKVCTAVIAKVRSASQ